jgi:hypothetical protein
MEYEKYNNIWINGNVKISTTTEFIGFRQKGKGKHFELNIYVRHQRTLYLWLMSVKENKAFWINGIYISISKDTVFMVDGY